MKTLDEVIKVFSEAIKEVGCGDCQFNDAESDDIPCEMTDCIFTDALNYLKEYKTNQEDPDGDHQQLEKARNLLWKFYQNGPLTWDELKAMEGKPVWVEYGCDFNQKRWVIIGSFHGRKNEFQYMDVSGGYPNTFWEKDMGEDEFWQAYRKER